MRDGLFRQNQFQIKREVGSSKSRSHGSATTFFAYFLPSIFSMLQFVLLKDSKAKELLVRSY